ncbi:MAG: MinD/ParA family protein [Firmicutes bacterium]|nr:MinD/ParA family protein [Bacillota bacterium]
MKDQAQRLRSLVAAAGIHRPLSETTSQARVISITSGKGGVGKTTLAVNLALAAQKAGLSTVLFDADLGLANIDIVLGLLPSYNLMHVLRGEKTISQITYEGPEGLRLVAGGSGWAELANLNKSQLGKFIAGLAELDSTSDLILVDTGAGLSESVLSFLSASQEIIVVTTPEPTAITDAYAVIKQLSKQENKCLHVVVNRARHRQEAEAVFRKIATTANRFLQVDLNFAGWIPEDSLVTRSIIRQQPVVLQYPNSGVAAAICRLQTVLFSSAAPKEDGLRAFFSRLARFLGG